MHSHYGGEIKGQKVLDLNPRQTWVRLAIIAGLTVLYSGTFRTIGAGVGPVGAALVAVPVAAAGWYFGIGAGLIAGFFGIALSASLLAGFEGSTFFAWIVNGWPGNLMVLAAGYTTGLLHRQLGERQHAVDELRSRERFLALMNIATQSILDPKTPRDIYYYLVTHLANLFTADYGYLTHWDETQAQAILVAATKSTEQHFFEVVLKPDETSLTTSVLRDEHPLAISDVPHSPFVVNPAFFRGLSFPTQSALCIPLIAEEYKFGAATLAFDAPRRFTDMEITFAKEIGKQIALALWIKDQQLKIGRQLRESNALAHIERALSETERVGIETVFQLIVDSAKQLIPAAEYVVLHLLDEEKQVLVARAVAGFENRRGTALTMHPGEGVAGRVIATGEVISVSDIRTDPRFLNRTTPVNFRSLIVAPVQSNQRMAGTISIQSDRPNVFTPDESRLLDALGTQAAVAIENANLLETTQQDLKEINALYRVSQGLAASLDYDQLMKDVVDLLHENFGYYYVQIFVLDPEKADLVARYGSGEAARKFTELGLRLPVGAGIVGHVAETGQPFLTNDVDTVSFFVRHPLMSDTQSELTVPIKIGNQVLGVLNIEERPPNRIPARHLSLMSAVADQLAVALQKANLYTKLQTSLHQEKAMRASLMQSERLALVGRLLASVSHELNNPLQAIQNVLFLLKDEEKLSVEGRQDLEVVLSETERMASLISRLRAAYRPARAEDFLDIQLNAVVEDVRALTATYMRHKKIAFEFQSDPALPVMSGVPGQIQQVILNLFINAIEAMQMEGRLTVQTRNVPGQDRILLSVTDTGPGIAPQILSHIFEPFVTDKDAGTGLGLTITRDIIMQHYGDIQGRNNPGGGATFEVWFPAKREG